MGQNSVCNVNCGHKVLSGIANVYFQEVLNLWMEKIVVVI